ncbi:OmpA family protein [Desulfovibrio sp. OttesenSCG-928-F07]|nr:OmpA family protein [Desulfovibrio sp. OttesenSCG-928-F07]
MADDEDPPKEAPDPPAPMGVAEWMVTYGDMMTLLLCFFVLLFIFAKSDENKYKSAIGSIQEAFGVQTARPESPFHAFSPSPDEAAEKIIKEAENDLYSTLQEIVNDVIQNDPDLKQSMRIETEETGVKLIVRNNKLFLPGTSYLNNDARQLLRPVIEAANRHNFNILVRNNSPKSDLNEQYFPSVWELSGARAGAALRALVGAGKIPATRLKAMAMGDSAPLFPEHDPANAQANNRTEFLFYFPGKEIW